MTYTRETAHILSKTRLAPGIFDITLSSPAVAAAGQAGQFVHIACDGHILRRPISLCGFDAAAGTIRLVLEVRGDGTAWLARQDIGGSFDIIGPLGRGFPPVPAGQAVLVGGGIGTPPLLPLAQYYGAAATVVTGFRTAAAVILQEAFADTRAPLLLATDDGTAGFHGYTTALLQRHLAEASCDVIYTCGPFAMMREVAAIAGKKGIRCYVSLEERMACGVGACLGCTCAAKDGANRPHQTRVCADGPVFDAEEIIW